MKKTKFAKFTVDMTDEKMYEILNQYINSTSTAIGGNIEVHTSSSNTSMKPKSGHEAMKYEDTQYLHETLNGAYQFLLWLRRDGLYRKAK